MQSPGSRSSTPNNLRRGFPAPEPQRSALAFFYLNEFSHREMQNLLDVKMSELASLISHGRSQFQAWLNSVTIRNEAVAFPTQA